MARAVHADPRLLDESSLSRDRHRLQVWARFAPHLLDDEREVAIADGEAQEVARLVRQVLQLDDVPATSHRVGDDLAGGLDDPDPRVRREADDAGRAVTRRRAAATAPVLLRLARLQETDDVERGLGTWRSRRALIEGTTTDRLDRLIAGVIAEASAVQPWFESRRHLCGSSYADRRWTPSAPTRTLEEDTDLACAVLARVAPGVEPLLAGVAPRVVAGQISECVVERGEMTVTVAHRGTLRSTLMTGHEVGHAVHALASEGCQPPGALVGEAMACLVAVLVADELTTLDEPAVALACGDHLIDEILLSAAASQFEDAVRDPVGSIAGADDLAALWLSSVRAVYEPAIEVPDEVGVDWARHPGFVTAPGQSVAYVWATLFALVVVDSSLPDLGHRLTAAMSVGAMDADDLLTAFDIEPDHLLERGVAAFRSRLDRCAGVAFG